jgi:putative transcriptional regulator
MAKKPSPMTEAILETATDLHDLGIMSDEDYKIITLRHLGEQVVPAEAPISGEEIRSLRESAHMSQAVFARHLNLTAGYVSQIERGTKQPNGPALALLNVMKRKGVGVIL